MVKCRFTSISAAVEVRVTRRTSADRAAQLGARLAREMDARALGTGGQIHVVHSRSSASLHFTITLDRVDQLDAALADVERIARRLIDEFDLRGRSR